MEHPTAKTFTYSVEPDDVLHSRTLELSGESEADTVETISLLSIQIGQNEYALHTGEVRQVVSTANVMPVPQAPRHVLGITNMRGDIVSVFDLEALTIDKPMATVERPNLIQVDYEDTTVCFAVAEPPNSLTIPVDTIKKQASNPPADPNNLVAEYVELGEHLIQIIPAERLLAHRSLVQLISSYSAE